MSKIKTVSSVCAALAVISTLSYLSVTEARLTPGPITKAPATEPHNVILLIADDYGVDMAQLYNDPTAGLPPTPNINALLDAGVLFENAWTNPICSPTRAAMLTGRYGFRTGIGNTVSNSGSPGLPYEEFVLPEAISAGSPFTHTHANVGKWHLGTAALGGRFHPTNTGYDHFSGLLSGGLSDYYDWTKVKGTTSTPVTTYATTDTVNDAIEWLDTQHEQDKPFFLWVAFNAPHTPFHVPPLDLHSYDTLTTTQSVIDADPYPYYSAAVEALDTEIGRLLNSLPTDVRNNTTVIFIGDNGTPGQVARDPLTNQRAKGKIYDGGVNVPLIISGPKVNSPNRISDALVNSVDMFATVLELIGVDVSATVPNTITLDSVSMVPYMQNTIHESPRPWIFAELFTEGGGPNDGKTIRNDTFKLLHFDSGDIEFYNIAEDPYEQDELLTSGNPLSTAEEQAYCGLFTDYRDLLSTESGQTIPDMPLLCQSVQTFTPTPIPTETATETSTPTLASTLVPTATATNVDATPATATATPEQLLYDVFLAYLINGSSSGTEPTSTPTATLSRTETPQPTNTPVPQNTPTAAAGTDTPTPPPTTAAPTATATIETVVIDSPNSICNGVNDFSQIPSEYSTALLPYTTLNSEYIVNVCTEDSNNNGSPDFMVIESTNIPEHESSYFTEPNDHYEDYDYETNIFKFAPVYVDQRTGSAGQNKIEQQSIIMKIPISPQEAVSKENTRLGTIGIAFNGVSFYNESAAPGDEITDELFTFDQCSGHPQGSGVYHYHVDPVCLIRDLGGDILTETQQDGGTTYTWIADAGTNAELLLGFLRDGFPVYGPIGSGGEVDCNGAAVNEVIDSHNGHIHCTNEFPGGIFHYHAKTANIGGGHDPVFWITNAVYYGEVGELEN